MRKEAIAGAIMLSAIVAAAGSAMSLIYPEFQPPNADAMRAYRLSGVSDEQLRELYRRAENEASKNHVLVAREKDAARSSLQKQYAECVANRQDPAFRARQPAACDMLALILLDNAPSFTSETADDVFEDKIIGPCRSARTTYEARQLGCLAPNWIDHLH